ncbi:MAG: hypothetical protein ACOYK9_06085 [Chlamydiia bacterium]
MLTKKILAMLALSLLSSPLPVLQASASPLPSIVQESSQKFDYIHPPQAHHLDAPLPPLLSSQHIVGIYGNILYPQDQEQLGQKKLVEWIEAFAENPKAPFPLSSEEFTDISLYILDRFALGTIRHYFASAFARSLESGQPLEIALETAKKETFARALLYREIGQNIPKLGGRSEILEKKFLECADSIEKITTRDAKTLRKNPEAYRQILKSTTIELIQKPLTWDVRTQVLKQMVDKVTALSPNSPYFLALQEVTPQALDDLKETLKNRNLQWISFNNMSDRATLPAQQEAILGEATGFTSTIALSPDLEILKVELGDLPTESGSIRKILGVRVRNCHTNKVFNLFSTHTDHKIQNEIYERTAAKIHGFATEFFSDAPLEDRRFIAGGDLNVFEQLGGGKYVQMLHTLFKGAQDFRETDYYAPKLVAWSSYIGRPGTAFLPPITKDGVEPSGLDQILVGNGVKLHSAAREALVYDTSGRLLDYHENRDEYRENLEKRNTFSDHFFNIVRFE